VPKNKIKMVNPQDEMMEMKKVIQIKLNKDKEKRDLKLDIQESCTICIEEFESNP
jgi:hypothetical protein